MPTATPLREPRHAVFEPTPWLDGVWKRNRCCEYCTTPAEPGPERLECIYCNVVAHVVCALPQAAAAASQGWKPVDWVCCDCRFVMKDCRRAAIIAKNQRKLEYTRHVSTVAIQARVRSYIHQRPFSKLKRTVVILQGVVRCLYARRKYRSQHINAQRPYAIKILGVTSLDAALEYSCIVSIVRNDGGLLPSSSSSGNSSRRKPNGDASSLELSASAEATSRRTLYQFNTKFDRPDISGTLGHDGGVVESFLVPSTACGVTVFVTLVSNATTVGEPAGSPPLVFHGQVKYDLEQDLLYNRRTIRCLTCVTDLDDCFEPRERPGSSQTLRMLRRPARQVEWRKSEPGVDDPPPIIIRLQLLSFPVALSHHGLLDEVSSVFSRKAVRRRWWCLLVDHVLYLYKAHTEHAPHFSVQLSRARLKLHHASGVLEIKSPERALLVSQADPNARSAWFRKLKENADAAKSMRRGGTPVKACTHTFAH